MPEVIFNGADGRLEGRYHHGPGGTAPLALILHPHPLHGGTMNNKIVYDLFHVFARRGFSVLRFNLRGVGRSQGSFDHGQGELRDAAGPCPRLLPQLLLSPSALAVHRRPSGKGPVIMLKPEIEDGQMSLADPAFRADVLAGLERRPRAIPARWFYDRKGSELFEAITDLPEYYPTRTETTILKTMCPDLVAHVGKGRAVVEFGSGSSTKTPVLLRWNS